MSCLKINKRRLCGGNCSDKCQQGMHRGFEKCFYVWGTAVTNCTWVTFLISLLVFLYAGSGFRYYKNFENEQFVWTPEDNPSIYNGIRTHKLFWAGYRYRPQKIIALSKDIETNPEANLLTKEAIQEMIEFEKLVYSITENHNAYANPGLEVVPVRPEGGKPVSLNELCQTIPKNKSGPNILVAALRAPECVISTRVLDYFWNETEAIFDLSLYEDDKAVLSRIQEGQSEKTIFKNQKDFLLIDDFLSETYPKKVNQNMVTGKSNILRAKAMRWEYVVDSLRVPGVLGQEYWFDLYENNLQEAIQKFTLNSKHIDFFMMSNSGVFQAFQSDLVGDLVYVQFAIALIFIYSVLFLGACSPIHCRMTLASVGIGCIFLSYLAGFGICFIKGLEVTNIHNLIPFLLLGIGVDDMFVLCNALDQTPMHYPYQVRIKESLKHAGPSITITSFTNALAFYFGSTTSLIAVRSFCQFATVSVCMLYFSVLTIFVCAMVWDTQRVQKRNPDCCRLFCCKESTSIFCGGTFLSEQQKEFSAIPSDSSATKKKSNLNSNQVTSSTSSSADQRINSKSSGGDRRSAFKSPNSTHQTSTKDSVEGTEQTPLESTKRVIASGTEKFLAQKFAPALLSQRGKFSVIFIYLMMIGWGVYGVLQVRIDFGLEYMVNPDAAIYPYIQMENLYFQTGMKPSITWDPPQTDILNPEDTIFETEEQQLALIEFNDRLLRCQGCSSSWHRPGTLDSWYENLRKFVSDGRCSKLEQSGLDIFLKVIPREHFRDCLNEFLLSDQGKPYADDIDFSSSTKVLRNVLAFRQEIQTIEIKSLATDGVDYLRDVRKIEAEYGLDRIFSFDLNYLDIEQYFVFMDELYESMGLSFVAIVLVVFFITANILVTILVVLAVALVDFFLLALLHYWSLTLNFLVTLNMIFAIGLAVDFSAHIAHTFLVTKPGPHCKTKSEARTYKAKQAVSQMGSSVVHGGVSTFLAISVLSQSKSYIFVVFFRLWFGIIIFGMSNGFLLLPVILSFIGPVENLGLDEEKNESEERPEVEMKQTMPPQLDISTIPIEMPSMMANTGASQGGGTTAARTLVVYSNIKRVKQALSDGKLSSVAEGALNHNRGSFLQNQHTEHKIIVDDKTESDRYSPCKIPFKNNSRTISIHLSERKAQHSSQGEGIEFDRHEQQHQTGQIGPKVKIPLGKNILDGQRLQQPGMLLTEQTPTISNNLSHDVSV